MNTKFLDGVRFLLSLWVVIAHFYTLVGGPFFFEFPAKIQSIIMVPLDAVYGFMIITGFLMAYNYINRSDREPYADKNSFYNFWLRRFFRLYPVYILAIIVTYLLFTHIATNNEQNLLALTGTTRTASGNVREKVQPGVADLISHILMIHGVIPKFHVSILGVTWSLSLEMQFYLVFPFLFLFVFRSESIFRKRFLVLLFISVYIAYKMPYLFGSGLTPGTTAHFILPSFLPYTFPLFLLGMVIAGVGLHKLNFQYLFYLLVIILPFQDALTTFLISFLIIMFYIDNLEATMPAWLFKIFLTIRRWLSGGIAEAGANISYSMYLIHTTVISFVLRLVIEYAQPFVLGKKGIAIIALLLTLMATFAISYLLYILVEKPCIRFSRSFISKKTRNLAG